MERAIVGFHRDEAGDWVAELACGHGQHVRHDPPWQSRPWVADEAGRQRMVGTQLDCPYCDMGSIPPDAQPYKRTATFSETSVPTGLLRDHRTATDVWAQIIVESGKLEYHSARGTFVLRPGIVGIVEPTRPHRVRPLGAVRFHVVFLRAPQNQA